MMRERGSNSSRGSLSPGGPALPSIEDPDDMMDNAALLGGGRGGGGGGGGGINTNAASTSPRGDAQGDVFNEIPMCGFLSVRYYQPYFDVDTSDVLARLSNSIMFLRRPETLLSLVGEKPDIYGPFWVSQFNNKKFKK